MTSSSRCDVCNVITHAFRYNNPRKDPNDINDGRWLCEEHMFDGMAPPPDKNSVDTSSTGGNWEPWPSRKVRREAKRLQQKKTPKVKF